jgi:hypothetical protein
MIEEVFIGKYIVRCLYCNKSVIKEIKAFSGCKEKTESWSKKEGCGCHGPFL